ncbi:MAG: caspase family protein [Pseudomonadota bacterium]
MADRGFVGRLLALMWLALLPSLAMAEPRIALIVGNGAYTAVAQLDNPTRDAALIAKAVEAAGFSVTLLTNADQATLNQGIARFGRDLRAAGPDATGLFFYAGHGVQSFGANYLLPVDAALTDAADLGLVAIPADTVLRQMGSARNKTNIFILDACRNNPFVDIPDMDDNGLAEMKAPTGTFLAYATAPGAVALDGLTSNSPFTAALATEVLVPGLPIEQVFKQVRVKVLAETGGQQTPWDTSSLTAPFVFQPAQVESAADMAARQLWDSVKATNDPVQIMLFLRAYPDSTYAEDARAALTLAMNSVLEPGPATAAPVTRAAPAPVPSPVPAAPPADPREAELIEVARTSGAAADYEAYLAAFPNGTYAELAAFELTMLAANPPAPAPEAAPVAAETPEGGAVVDEPDTLTFATPLTTGGAGVAGLTIEELAKGSPLFAPIEGIPEEMWKGQTCANCHAWTKEALCDQGKTYVSQSGERALTKPHPYGGSFKRALRVWAKGGCK